MNKQEMKDVLSDYLASYRKLSYSELQSMLESNQIDTPEVKSPSGADYQIEIYCIWDDKPFENIRVLGSIDENPLKPFLGFIPLFFTSVTDSFIMAPEGSFIDE